MRFEKVTFPNGRGQMLRGRIDHPLSDPIAYALYAHCFTCTKNLRAAGRISETLAAHGIATLRFDFTGLGESEGNFADTNFSTSAADVLAAASFLEGAHRAAEILIGHSLGGAVALRSAAELGSVAAVVTIAAPATPEHVKRHLADDLDVIEAEGQSDVLLAGRPFTIKQQLLDDLAETSLEPHIRSLGRPLLVLHSPVDNTVGVENAAEIMAMARHPKSFISLDDADHLISTDSDARYVAEVIVSWASRYLAGNLVASSQPDPRADDPESVTVVRIEAGFRTQILANGFPLVADEPVAVGGTNTGPSPYDYLLAALGSCTAMTLRMYADRKGWQLDAVTVRLSHTRVHARDCADCESEEGYVDRIERVIELAGDLDREQRARLGEIADRCPVHKTLHSEVVVRSDLTGLQTHT